MYDSMYSRASSGTVKLIASLVFSPAEQLMVRMIAHPQSVNLHCSCSLPEEKGDKMAECDMCKTWYHQHCMDIPDNVFDETDVPWKCKSCATE